MRKARLRRQGDCPALSQIHPPTFPPTHPPWLLIPRCCSLPAPHRQPCLPVHPGCHLQRHGMIKDEADDGFCHLITQYLFSSDQHQAGRMHDETVSLSHQCIIKWCLSLCAMKSGPLIPCIKGHVRLFTGRGFCFFSTPTPSPVPPFQTSTHTSGHISGYTPFNALSISHVLSITGGTPNCLQLRE